MTATDFTLAAGFTAMVIGSAEDIGAAIARQFLDLGATVLRMLASSTVTGSVVTVDGGFLAG